MRQKLLYDYFYNKAYKENRPVSVMIELLTKCNLRCEHCYLPEHCDTGLETKKVKELLIELKELGVINVSLTGGEIFLRDDLFEIIEFARSLHMRVFLLSNGTLLDKNIILKLKRLHIAEFSTTVFSLKEEIHDSITKCEGSLAILLKNLEELKDSGITVRVKTPLMKKNMYEYKELYNYCKKNGFDYLVSPLIFSKNDGDTSPKSLRITDEELYSVMRDIDMISRNDHLHIKDVPCAAIFYSFAIDCHGDVFPCNSFFYKVGNIYEESLRDIWYSSKELKKIKSIRNSDLIECTNCEYKTRCDRCPGMVFMEEKNLLSCDQFAKQLAKIRALNYTTLNEI